jgi:hypothetical protein
MGTQMSDEISLPELCVRVVTGSTLYPAEGGFSSVFAEIVSSDRSLVANLRLAQREGRTVTLRCAALRVIGRVTKYTKSWLTHKIVVAVDDLQYEPGTKL